MKIVISSMIALIFFPVFAIETFKYFYPNDPDLVYINQPSLFSGKWEKVAYSKNFSEYIDPNKIEKKFDATVDIVTLRNFYKPQFDDYTDQNQHYKSQISYETIDCFNETITVNKMFLLGGQFAGGSLIAEPIEPVSTPIRVDIESIGFRKIRKVCELAKLHTDPQQLKSNFMNNI